MPKSKPKPVARPSAPRSPRQVLRPTRKGGREIVTVDAETWAGSGGTAGLYGRFWRERRLKIVPGSEED